MEKKEYRHPVCRTVWPDYERCIAESSLEDAEDGDEWKWWEN